MRPFVEIRSSCHDMVAVQFASALQSSRASTKLPIPLMGGAGLFFLLILGCAMVKETRFFRKQGAKAERMARSTSDAEISQSFFEFGEGISQSGKRTENGQEKG